MNRATLVYALMVVVCVGGLWGILRAGAGLQAPPDLSGAWEIVPADPTEASGLGGTVSSMTIEQSGRYFQIRLSDGRVLDLKLLDAVTLGDPSPLTVVRLGGAGREWTAYATAHDGGESLTIRVNGLESGHFIARRGSGDHPPRPSQTSRPPAAAGHTSYSSHAP